MTHPTKFLLFGISLALLLFPRAQAAFTEDGLWMAEEPEPSAVSAPLNLLSSAGETIQQNGIRYTLTDSEAAVSGYTADIPENCTIPATITHEGEGYTVTKIDSGGLYNCTTIKTLTLPNTLTALGNNALAGCTSLQTVTFLGRLDEVGRDAFKSSSALQNINVTSDLGTYYSEDGVLFGDTRITTPSSSDIVLTLIQYPIGRTESSYTVPEGTGAIGDYAFYRASNLQSVTMQSGLKVISDYAFDECTSLNAVVLPEGLLHLGNYSFGSCYSLSTICLPSTLKSMYSSPFWEDPISKIEMTEGVSTYSTDGIALYENTTATADETTSYELAYYAISFPNSYYEVKSGTTTIGGQAFWGAENLTAISFPNNLTTIEFGAFTKTGLVNVSLPSSVTEIDEYAFQSSKFLKNVTLGSASSIPKGAFQGCKALQYVYVPKTVTEISATSFTDCYALENIAVDKENQNFSSQNGVLYNSDMTGLILYPGGKTDRSFEVPKTVKAIQYGAFQSVSALESISVEEGNSKYSATEDGVLLEHSEDASQIVLHTYPLGKKDSSYTVPENVTVIASNAFYSNKILKSISLSNTKTISEKAFYNSKLESADFGEKLESIEYAAFCSSKLKAAVLPSSLIYAQNQAFDYCRQLEYITFEGTTPPETVGRRLAYYCDKLRYVYVPEGTQSAYLNAFSQAGSTIAPGAIVVEGGYVTADTVKEEIASATSKEEVNTAAIHAVRLTTEDRAGLTDTEWNQVNARFTEENAITETVQSDRGITAERLSLASGLTETLAAGESIDNAQVELSVTEKTPQAKELLRLDFNLRVNGTDTQPVIPVTVHIPLSNEILSADFDLIHKGTKEETIAYTRTADGITFEASGFSDYILRENAVYATYTLPDGVDSATLILAYYNSDGKMLRCSVETVSAGGQKKLDIPEGETCKAFLLNTANQPIGSATVE